MRGQKENVRYRVFYDLQQKKDRETAERSKKKKENACPKKLGFCRRILLTIDDGSSKKTQSAHESWK